LREAVDIDLLVRPEHFLQADAQMERLGYVRCYPDFALDPKAFSGLQRVEKSATYLRSGDGTQVDLHWRTARNPYLRPDFDRTWPDRVAAVAGGPWAGLPCPNPADTLSYVIVHGCHAGWVRLKWLADLHHLAESLPDALVAQSLDDLDKTGLLPLAASARSLCEATLGTEFSSVWDKALPTPASDRLLCLQEGFVADADVQPSNPWTRAVKKRRLQALRKALRQDADYRAHQTRIAVMTPWLRGRVGRGLVTALGRRL
jgi:hypothetical protein